jgi:hypothetical protein
MGLLGFDNFADAFDGGGAGQSGDSFSGGPLSELLNALGIRPHGFGARQMGERPMPNPAYSQPRVSTSGGPAPSYAYVAGRPDIPMPGGMPPMPQTPQMAAPSYAMVAGRPELPPVGQPNLTPEQMQQILMRLGLQSAGNTFGGGMR